MRLQQIRVGEQRCSSRGKEWGYSGEKQENKYAIQEGRTKVKIKNNMTTKM
jgi:hypothetical protein